VTVIETEGLTKRFRHVVAVDGVSLSVPTGARFGLLGSNGSGKTTLVRMLLGLVHPTAGRVALLGRPMPREAAHVLPRVGALVEGPAAWPHLSGRTNLKLLDAAGRSGRRDRADRVEEALVRVGLGGIDGRPVRAYSLGMRQRLGIAAALLRKPELLLLDEPTNGLDPRGIGEMRALLRHFAAQGTTVVLSSHLLSEVEALCTRVGVMSAGRLVLTADLDTLRAPTGLVQVRTPDPAAAVGVLDGRVVHRDGDLVVVRADDPAALNARLVAAGVAVHELTALRRTLEQVVLELTGPSADRVDRPGGDGGRADAASRLRRVGRGRAADDRRVGRPDDHPTHPGGHGNGQAESRGTDWTGRTDRADGGRR
jgi:ABC-type multidrug transport system ATPase subunit